MFERVSLKGRSSWRRCTFARCISFLSMYRLYKSYSFPRFPWNISRDPLKHSVLSQFVVEVTVTYLPGMKCCRHSAYGNRATRPACPQAWERGTLFSMLTCSLSCFRLPRQGGTRQWRPRLSHHSPVSSASSSSHSDRASRRRHTLASARGMVESEAAQRRRSSPRRLLRTATRSCATWGGGGVVALLEVEALCDNQLACISASIAACRRTNAQLRGH